LKEAWFDYIIVETVGVGQSEVEIAGLADTTIVVLVPEGGDEIQTMKAGLMEIADIFVVNKSDRPGADNFIRNLKMIMPSGKDVQAIPVVKTVASEKNGIAELIDILKDEKRKRQDAESKSTLLVERAYHLIQNRRMKDIKKPELKVLIERQLKSGNFNLYSFVGQLGGN
jgi:LAO/AO transport system kinase